MENLDLREMLRSAINWELLEVCIREQLTDSIDYDEIAEKIIGDFDITEAVMEMLLPF